MGGMAPRFYKHGGLRTRADDEEQVCGSSTARIRHEQNCSQMHSPEVRVCARAVLNGEKKSVPLHSFPKKARRHSMCSTMVGGGWRLAVGGGWRLAVGNWRLAVGGGWRLAVGNWRLAVGGGWRLAVGNWRLVAVGSR